jgi:hypothetical protein
MNLSKHMNDGLKRSLRVLRAVKVTACSDDIWIIGTYLNGRENGLRIHVYNGDWKNTRSFVIAENRNSDSMVLYSGQFEDFDYAAIPNEAVYKNAQYFASEKELVAVLTKAITQALKTKSTKRAA